MAEPGSEREHKRTAVLVVHGIGSQRALETVRGVIRGVWLDSDNPCDTGRRIWTHPERYVADIDLSVMTTNEVSGSKDGRIVDFHELYWAHLMSETKAVAVLLWLYELCRKGPIMTPGINGLWWAASIFLCLMNLSFAVLALQAAFLLSQSHAQILLTAPFLLLFSSVTFGLLIAFRWRASRLVRALALFCAIGLLLCIGYFVLEAFFPGGDRSQIDGAELATKVALPTGLALLATYLLAGRHGLRAFWRALVISLLVSAVFAGIDHYWSSTPYSGEILAHAWVWGLNSPWSVALAFAVIGLYLAVNAAFLQPYLGDAARYFRSSPANVAVRRAIRKEAVDTLDHLHEQGYYDRIVVVAHSLGCVISYDMLRAYFSRICSELPPVAHLGDDFADIDIALWQPELPASVADKKAMRTKARRAIASIAAAAAEKPGQKPESWVVTDFITLGSALTHAQFLMCLGQTRSDLESDFARRVGEREFPTCPPKRLDQDDLLTFYNPKLKAKQVHHGALFGLTRWTNIYFPMQQIFWGDAIGGPLAPIFGSHIVDYPVSTSNKGGADFFTHTAYWDVDREPDRFQAPHIVALRKAVDLADTGDAIAVVDDADQARVLQVRPPLPWP
jgi:hypothetical protein